VNEPHSHPTRRELLAGAAGLPILHQTDGGPRVVSVENGGLLFTDNPAGVSGTDAGYSLRLGNRTLWLFGDVFLLHPTDPKKPYVAGLSNCGLLVPRGTGPAPLRRYRFLTDPKTGLARPLMPNLPGEDSTVRYWPFGGWHDAANRRAWLYFARIYAPGGGPLNFKTLGQGLMSASTDDLDRITFTATPAPDGGQLWWKTEAEPLFGAAVISDSPGDWLYVVGVDTRGRPRPGKMARVPKAKIADRAAYEYLADGAAARWSPRVEDAADVKGLDSFSEMSVAYNRYLRGWLAVHTVGTSERVRLSLAERPWGPYRRLAEIRAPHRAFEKSFCYAGKEHPELAEEGGKVLYLTYVDQQRYWLQLLKVTLER
jgi:hypothetical protein